MYLLIRFHKTSPSCDPKNTDWCDRGKQTHITKDNFRKGYLALVSDTTFFSENISSLSYQTLPFFFFKKIKNSNPPPLQKSIR